MAYMYQSNVDEATLYGTDGYPGVFLAEKNMLITFL